MGIESTMSTKYHPQTDGQIEYVNWIWEQYLKCYVDYDQKTGQTCYQVQSLHTTIKHMKKQIKVLKYGRNPRAGPILVKKLLNKNLNDLIYKKARSFRAGKNSSQSWSRKNEIIQCHVSSFSYKQANSEPTINEQKLLWYHQSKFKVRKNEK